MRDSARVLRSHTKRDGEYDLKTKQTDSPDVKTKQTDKPNLKTKQTEEPNLKSKQTGKPKLPTTTARRLVGTTTTKRPLLAPHSHKHSCKVSASALLDTPSTNTPAASSTEEHRITSMGPPSLPTRAAKLSANAPTTPVRLTGAAPPAIYDTTPIARSTDSKQTVSGLQATPTISHARRVQLARNFANYGHVGVTEHANLIDTVYPPLNPSFSEKILQDNYINGKWKGWPETPDEKPVFEWLRNLEVEIRKANSSNIQEKDDTKTSPITVSSRIIFHGQHPVQDDSIEAQKPDYVFIDNESAFLCRRANELDCTCKGVVCHCKLENRSQKCAGADSADTARVVMDSECFTVGQGNCQCELPSLRWKHFRAFAEHKRNLNAIGKHSASAEFIFNLLDRAKQMFYHQPTRTHLHCFALGGDHLRCFLITRSGVVTSEAFSIHDNPKVALRVLSAFFCGDLEWYGLKTAYYVKNVRGERLPYDCTSRKMERIDPYYDVTTSDRNFTLVVNVKDPVCRRRELISRGTFCFKARKSTDTQWNKLIKEAWRMSKRGAEGDLLRKATLGQQNVNLARYVHHEDVTSTSSIRRVRLSDGKSIPLKSPEEFVVSGRKATGTKRSSTQAGMDTSERNGKRCKEPEEPDKVEERERQELDTVVINKSDSRKRKLLQAHADADTEERRPLKRSRSATPFGTLALAGEEKGGMNTKTIIPNLRLNSATTNMSERSPVLKFTDAEITPRSISIESDDRTLGRLVLDSFGRDLRTFRTVEELLRGIRSALLGHRHLFTEYSILHRDISNNNILLPWPPTKEERKMLEDSINARRRQSIGREEDWVEESPNDEILEAVVGVETPESSELDVTGFLIDFDYAIEIDRLEASGARLRTGTTVFMAIELLEAGSNAKNSYLHDLHSFFYVLLYTLSERSPEFENSKIRNWMTKTDEDDIATHKMSLLHGEVWEKYTEEALGAWSPQSRDYQALQQLLKAWRDACFPIKRDRKKEEDVRKAKEDFNNQKISVDELLQLVSGYGNRDAESGRCYLSKHFESCGDEKWETKMYDAMIDALGKAIQAVESSAVLSETEGE